MNGEMKIVLLILSFAVFFPVSAVAHDDTEIYRIYAAGNPLVFSSPQDRAKKERGKKVTEVKEELVRRTVEAHGGSYRRVGQDVFLELTGKIYTDFTLHVVDGEYLVIESTEKTFKLKIVPE
jgi:hypothetical protein